MNTISRYTHPRPNFGLFLIKSHPIAVKAYQRAWWQYQKSPDYARRRVATDQNCVAVAMKWAKWRWNFNFSYFHLGYYLDTHPRPILDLNVLLLDKMEEVLPGGIRFELGGLAARLELRDAVAVHGTCYEGSTKLLVLKATNAHWNSKYYNPAQKTLTKPLMLVSQVALRSELAALTYLAMETNRTLIIPNVLIGIGSNVNGQPDFVKCRGANLSKSFYCNNVKGGNKGRNRHFGVDLSHAAFYEGEYYWPAFRTVHITAPEVSVLEPGFYYRVQEDMKLSPPRVTILSIDLSDNEPLHIKKIADKLLLVDDLRVVLDVRDSSITSLSAKEEKTRIAWLQTWASDSVSSWGPNVIDKASYVPVPGFDKGIIQEPEKLVNHVHMCRTFLNKVVGNRTCFSKCKAPNLKVETPFLE